MGLEYAVGLSPYGTFHLERLGHDPTIENVANACGPGIRAGESTFGVMVEREKSYSQGRPGG